MSKVPSYRELVKYKVEIRPHMTKVKRSGMKPPCRVPGKRGVVKGLSVASGLRLQETVASVDPAHGMPLFFTLTYPAEYPGNWSTWKRHLDNFRRTLSDNWGEAWTGGIWRLEAQRRGAPHFHVLVWHRFELEPETLAELRAWTSKAWYRIVASGDPKHLAAGTNVRVVSDVDDLRKVMCYLGKYLGKDSVHPDSQVFKNPVGRYWGVWRKEALLQEPETVTVDRETYLKIRRVLREYKARKRTRKPKGRETLNRSVTIERASPGIRCFLSDKCGKRLVDLYDEVPF